MYEQRPTADTSVLQAIDAAIDKYHREEDKKVKAQQHQEILKSQKEGNETQGFILIVLVATLVVAVLTFFKGCSVPSHDHNASSDISIPVSKPFA